jgi:hypothetical protein
MYKVVLWCRATRSQLAQLTGSQAPVYLCQLEAGPQLVHQLYTVTRSPEHNLETELTRFIHTFNKYLLKSKVLSTSISIKDKVYIAKRHDKSNLLTHRSATAIFLVDNASCISIIRKDFKDYFRKYIFPYFCFFGEHFVTMVRFFRNQHKIFDF